MINNNRQAGRRRGRGGQQQRPQGNSGRPDNGNRIDNRARGNASQLLEKYKTLARDAQMQGDRVNTEYYLQFADHYFRVLAETRSRFEDNRRQNGVENGAAFDEDEQEYDDDGEPVARVEQRPPERQNQGYAQGGGNGGQGGNGQYDDDRRPARNTANGNSGDHDRADRYVRDDRGDNSERQDRQNGDRPQRQANDRYERNDRPANDRNNDRQGNDRPYNDRQGNDRSGSERVNRAGYAQDDEGVAPVRREERTSRPERAPRLERAPRRDNAPRQEEAAQPEAGSQHNEQQVGQQEEPRRRGRPRREVQADVPGFEADRLPPSLGISAIVPDAGPVAEKKPRARRVRPAADESPAAE